MLPVQVKFVLGSVSPANTIAPAAPLLLQKPLAPSEALLKRSPPG